MNFLNVLELFRIKRIDYSFWGLGVISQSLPISPWHANPQRFEFRTAACCLYWIGGGCHQIPSCHSDELGMTDQKLVLARVDRLTPIPSRQQQQQQSKVTAQEFVLFIICRWTFGIETNSGFTLKCRGHCGVCMYVRTSLVPTQLLSIWRHLYHSPSRVEGAGKGLFSCLCNWSGYFDSPEERNSTWQEKSNKATAFLVVVHTVVVDDGVYRNIKRKERRPQLRHSGALVIVFMAKDKTEFKTRHFSCFGFF